MGCEGTRRWKASWSGEAVAFDEAAVEAGRAAHGDGDLAGSNLDWVHTGSLQRTSEAMSHARSAAENARIGRLGAEEQRSKLHQDCAGSDDMAPGAKTSAAQVSVAAEAEAGESPSSEAPLGGSSGKRFGVPIFRRARKRPL